MNPQYSGPNMSMAGPSPITYSQPSQQSSFNGFESHSTHGYGQPPAAAPPPMSKAYSQGPYPGLNTSVQNGPAGRPMMNSYSSGGPSYNQNMSPQMQPPSVPTPPISATMTDQVSQRFGDMNINQNKGNPVYASSSLQRPPVHNAEMYRPPQIDMRPPVQQQSFQDPPPIQQQSLQGPPPMQQQSLQGPPPIQQQPLQGPPPIQQSLQGPLSTQCRPPLNPPLQHPPTSYASQDTSSMGRNARSVSADAGARYPTSAPIPPSSSHPMSSGIYNSAVGPPVSGVPNLPVPPTSAQTGISNGLYYPGNEQQQHVSPNLMGPSPAYASQANGPSMSPAMPQYSSQMPLQSRYPTMAPPPHSASGLAPLPPQPQYSSPPGMGNAPNQMPQQPMPPMPANQNRRLDPDNMPSPIQVIEDDKKLHTSVFVTDKKGQVPPLVTTDFVAQDGGICNPRFVRSTIYTVPTTADILKQTAVPFALSINPFAELHEGEQLPPISDLGEGGPVRCNRCKAYMCPFMQFIDGGRRFQCMFCKATTEVPPEYFAHLDHMGERVDKYQRAELCLGSYEFIATKEYCKNSQIPNDPAFVFVIDVSYNSVRNGMLNLLCEHMKSILSNLPRETEEAPSKIKVGFITYSNVVHFYNVKSNLAQPQMMVVPDVQEMFMPLLDGFLVDYESSADVIDSLLQQIPQMFAETRDTETILGPAIQAGLEALKAANCSGKLFVFSTTLPIGEGPGKLKNRDDRKLLGTEKEKTILVPQTQFYNVLGQDCVAAGCCVDLFLFPNAYMDIATIGQVCRLTGGQLYKYTYFQSDIDGSRFLEDLRRDVAKPIAFDAVIRVRTSTGIRPTDFWGNFFMANTTDIEVAAINCDKGIGVEIKYDDKLEEEDGAYIQTAILFTSCGGQRRLRIHNLSLNTSAQMADLFRSCELDTIMNVFSKQAIRMITEQTPFQVKDHFINQSAQILACYRKNCANRSSAGQLILPECMKLLPLYINCLIKSDAIAGGQEISTDDRSFVMLALNSMNVESSACYLYPRLLAMHDLHSTNNILPVATRCTIDKIKDDGAFLIENGLTMILWIGMGINSQWIEDVFAVPSVSRIDIDKTKLFELNTPTSKRVCEVINHVQKERQRHMKLIIIKQGDKLELLFRQLLVEDRTTEGSASYVDFLCHLHKEIRSLLT